MRQIQPYEFYQPTEELNYYFITSNGYGYLVSFRYSDRFFEENCTSCKDILEVDISCSCENTGKDYRIGATLFDIFSEILSDSCNGIMYRCDDEDGKGCQRELQFDKWHEDYDTDDKIDKVAQLICDEEDVCVKYYLLMDKGCINYESLWDDFNYRCRSCCGGDDIEEENCEIPD